MDELTVQTERVDDIPLLMEQQKRMGIADILNEELRVHGNRGGLSVGGLTTSWLSYILSEGDHRMMAVEEWAAERLTILETLTGEEVVAKDFTDDRLAGVLRLLSDNETWRTIERRLGERTIQVYDLHEQPVRLDSTSVVVHHETGDLFQYGYSKDRRGDLPQFKVMLATLDPLGMPLATLVPAGNEADDGWYLPAIERARAVMGQGGKLYIGDSKMSALNTRKAIAEAGDYYLTSLPRRHQGEDRLDNWLPATVGPDRMVQQVVVDRGNGPPTLWAIGYQQHREHQVDEMTWPERVLVLFRPSLARQERQQLDKRLAKAERELQRLVTKRPRPTPRFADQVAFDAVARRVMKEHRVPGLLEVTYDQLAETRHIRTYGDRPARTEMRYQERVTVRRKPHAIRRARLQLGWRLYVTNAPTAHLEFERAILTYRDAPRIELGFRRLKGRSLGIRPIYTHRQDHTLGLVRLLTLALRVLTLTEFVVRDKLKRLDQAIAGLYPGQPSRRTDRPTTERLLKAFKGIDLSLVHLEGRSLRHLTPLSVLHQRILTLLDLPATIYTHLTLEPSIPP